MYFDKFCTDFHEMPTSSSIFFGVTGQEMEIVKGQAWKNWEGDGGVIRALIRGDLIPT